jgi:hypothetical protein
MILSLNDETSDVNKDIRKWCARECVVLAMARCMCYCLHAALLYRTVLYYPTQISHFCHHFPLPFRVEEQVENTYKIYSAALPKTGTWSQG